LARNRIFSGFAPFWGFVPASSYFSAVYGRASAFSALEKTATLLVFRRRRMCWWLPSSEVAGRLQTSSLCVNFAGLGSAVLCFILHCGICNGCRHVNNIKWLRCEHGTENPRVGGSIPPLGTKELKGLLSIDSKPFFLSV